MDEIYMNVKPVPSKNQTGPRSSDSRFHGVVILCLGLLTVLLLAGLVSLGIHYHVSAQRSAAELSSIKANLQASDNKSSSLTEERDLLNDILANKTEELNMQSRPTCPRGWRMFKSVCYLLSYETGSWEKGKEDCGVRRARLVEIGSTAEQKFLSNFTKEETHAWIGLTDKDKEGTWKWIDGGPLTLQYWREPQPDNGGGHKTLGEEDCAHIIIEKGDLYNWNDLSCTTLLKWICEKRLQH